MIFAFYFLLSRNLYEKMPKEHVAKVLWAFSVMLVVIYITFSGLKFFGYCFP